MTTLQWTERAQTDLAAIRAFIEADSPHYASVTVRRILQAVDYLQDFLQSGRVVPEYVDPAVREVVLRPYRIVYRIVSADEIHVLTVYHGGARRDPRALARGAAQHPNGADAPTVLCDHVAAARGSFGALGRTEQTAEIERGNSGDTTVAIVVDVGA